jgi:membrane-bound serine protease (ClpP class)
VKISVPSKPQGSLFSALIFLLLLTVSASAFNGVAADQPKDGGVLTVKLEGTITAMSYELMVEALTHAEETGETVVLLIDTPGGTMDATFKIIDLIERSKVPVVGYVYPPGGKAWSAGTYILMATHVAAMAPHTIIGSCQPVSFDPLGGGSKPVEDSKIINAMEKYLVERAKAHGRSEETAKRFITENLNLDDEEALEAGVIEVRAENVGELLEKIDGMQVKVGGKLVTLNTAGALVEEWDPSFRVRFLGFLSEPMVAYLLLIIGLYGLIFGLASPGVGGEVLGAFLLILGLMGLGVTGANLGAIILMIVGLVLLLAELLTPGFGIMGGTGFACVFIGSFLLFPGDWTVQPEWLNMLYTVLMVVPIAVGGFFIFAAYKVVEARRRKPFQAGMIGEEAEAEGEITPEKGGFVRFKGELWKAGSRVKIRSGSRVKIVGKEGPLLVVEPLEGEEKA